ncbi:hypothetical protein E2C01_013492 [Portunus trituberculatus]|uniref:Uncharacterized protein n=1 Tax=Portunus trituberculatus TaxID=210409 RepID=A0A5B7DHG3_PORTR|nr:hypothetical protein [Portunus trituberculatus]
MYSEQTPALSKVSKTHITNHVSNVISCIKYLQISLKFKHSISLSHHADELSPTSEGLVTHVRVKTRT